MNELDTIRIFMRVVERGNFSAVAREIGIGQPAISKQIAALEAHLGVQLLRRTSHSFSLTDAGQDFYESMLRVIDELDAAKTRLRGGQTAPSGLVRATVAPVFGRLYVVPRLPEFFACYPEIAVELRVTDRSANLIEEGLDLAIHNGELLDSSLTARKIASTSIVTVATPTYLAGEPAIPAALDAHQCVIFAPSGAPRIWRFQGKSGAVSYQPKGSFRTNDAEQIRAAVLSDLGLAHAPGWLFAREIVSGTVRRVLQGFEPPPLAISAVHPAGRRLQARVRVFIDFLSEILSNDPNLHPAEGNAVEYDGNSA